MFARHGLLKDLIGNLHSSCCELTFIFALDTPSNQLCTWGQAYFIGDPAEEVPSDMRHCADWSRVLLQSCLGEGAYSE